MKRALQDAKTDAEFMSRFWAIRKDFKLGYSNSKLIKLSEIDFANMHLAYVANNQSVYQQMLALLNFAFMDKITSAQWKVLFGHLNVENLKYIESLIAEITASKQRNRQYQQQPEQVLTEAEQVKIIESKRVRANSKETKNLKSKKANLNDKID